MSTLRFLGDLAMSSSQMVNTGFRRPAHGFELVDVQVRDTPDAIINRKFTRPRPATIFA
jgi:hypothetical protein